MSVVPEPVKPKKIRRKTDPLILMAKKAYRGTPLFEVDKLLAEQTRWQRKRTIAENKLADVRKRMDEMLKTLATPLPSSTDENRGRESDDI